MKVADYLFDVLLADLSVNRLFSGKWAQYLAQAIAIRDRTIVGLQLQPQTDIQVQIRLLARSQRGLVLVLTKLTQPPLAHDEVLLVK